MIIMDWKTQMEQANAEMAKAWSDMQAQMTEAQKQMWAAMAENADKWNGSEMQAAWQQLVSNWQTMTDKTLEMQENGVNGLMGAVKDSPLGQNMGSWGGQMQEMAQQMITSQRTMWDNWFDMLQHADPAATVDVMGANVQGMMKQAQEMAQNVAEAQQAWLKSFTKPFTPEK